MPLVEAMAPHARTVDIPALRGELATEAERPVRMPYYARELMDPRYQAMAGQLRRWHQEERERRIRERREPRLRGTIGGPETPLLEFSPEQVRIAQGQPVPMMTEQIENQIALMGTGQASRREAEEALAQQGLVRGQRAYEYALARAMPAPAGPTGPGMGQFEAAGQRFAEEQRGRLAGQAETTGIPLTNILAATQGLSPTGSTLQNLATAQAEMQAAQARLTAAQGAREIPAWLLEQNRQRVLESARATDMPAAPPLAPPGSASTLPGWASPPGQAVGTAVPPIPPDPSRYEAMVSPRYGQWWTDRQTGETVDVAGRPYDPANPPAAYGPSRPMPGSPQALGLSAPPPISAIPPIPRPSPQAGPPSPYTAATPEQIAEQRARFGFPAAGAGAGAPLAARPGVAPPIPTRPPGQVPTTGVETADRVFEDAMRGFDASGWSFFSHASQLASHMAGNAGVRQWVAQQVAANARSGNPVLAENLAQNVADSFRAAAVASRKRELGDKYETYVGFYGDPTTKLRDEIVALVREAAAVQLGGAPSPAAAPGAPTAAAPTAALPTGAAAGRAYWNPEYQAQIAELEKGRQIFTPRFDVGEALQMAQLRGYQAQFGETASVQTVTTALGAIRVAANLMTDRSGKEAKESPSGMAAFPQNVAGKIPNLTQEQAAMIMAQITALPEAGGWGLTPQQQIIVQREINKKIIAG